jgi:hypothetical protein
MAIKITVQDLAVLSKFDADTKRVNFADRMVVSDPKTSLRLPKLGLTDAKGYLTEKGLELAENTVEKVKLLRNGLPIEKRKKTDPKAILNSELPWVVGLIKKKDWVSNGELFILGKPEKGMEAVKGSSELRQLMPTIVAKAASPKDLVEIEPKIWQMYDIGGLDFVWLNDDKGEGMTFVPIQSKYLDYIKDRYPSGKFFIRRKKADSVIQVRVTNRGLKNNIVALVMPFDLAGTMQIPKGVPDVT